jgi:hypothetical protein
LRGKGGEVRNENGQEEESPNQKRQSKVVPGTGRKSKRGGESEGWRGVIRWKKKGQGSFDVDTGLVGI